MNKLPDFFWADRLIPVNFYGYPSAVRERFCEIDANDTDPITLNRFHDFKKKCMAMYVDMRSVSDTQSDWRRDIWDNKIVIECRTETGHVIYVGFCDFTYSIGLSVEGRQARPYKQITYPSELAA